MKGLREGAVFGGVVRQHVVDVRTADGKFFVQKGMSWFFSYIRARTRYLKLCLYAKDVEPSPLQSTV